MNSSHTYNTYTPLIHSNTMIVPIMHWPILWYSNPPNRIVTIYIPYLLTMVFITLVSNSGQATIQNWLLLDLEAYNFKTGRGTTRVWWPFKVWYLINKYCTTKLASLIWIQLLKQDKWWFYNIAQRENLCAKGIFSLSYHWKQVRKRGGCGAIAFQ